MIKPVLSLFLICPLLGKKHHKRMFNDISNYSAEMVRKILKLVKSHMHGWDPQFDGDKILREDLEKYGNERLNQKPVNDVYQNFLLTNQVNLQVLLHSYFWTELSPIFKAELSELYDFKETHRIGPGPRTTRRRQC